MNIVRRILLRRRLHELMPYRRNEWFRNHILARRMLRHALPRMLMPSMTKLPDTIPRNETGTVTFRRPPRFQA